MASTSPPSSKARASSRTPKQVAAALHDYAARRGAIREQHARAQGPDRDQHDRDDHQADAQPDPQPTTPAPSQKHSA